MCAFAWGKGKTANLAWRGKQAAIACDELHRTITFEREGVEPRIRSIEKPQAQRTGGGLEKGIGRSVHIDALTHHPHHPRVHIERVNKAARAVDHAILHDERYVIYTVPARQIEAILFLVAHVDRGSKSGIDLWSGPAMQM